MYLARLIYTSVPTHDFSPDDISIILETARHNNRECSVTGLLYFNHRYFLQCLEGSRSNINKIYQRILNDNRHQDPLLLDYREIEIRDFPEWEMAYLPETEQTRSLYMRYSPTGEFSPYHMSGESCHQLMLNLRKVLPAV